MMDQMELGTEKVHGRSSSVIEAKVEIVGFKALSLLCKYQTWYMLVQFGSILALVAYQLTSVNYV